MKNNEKITLVGIKNDLAWLPRFKDGCYVCHSQTAKGGMTFHHLWYLPDEKTYKNFSSPLEYYKYLAPLVKENPRRFLYVCNIHHQAITRLRQWRGKNFERLVKAVRMTL